MQKLTEMNIQESQPVSMKKFDQLFKLQNRTANSELKWIWQLIKNTKSSQNIQSDVKISHFLTGKYFITSNHKNYQNAKRSKTPKKGELQQKDVLVTSVKYEIGDYQNFGVIEQAVNNVKALISYVFLFNPNIKQYKFIDERARDKNLSFSIKRMNLKQVNKNVAILKYQISEEIDKRTSIFINYRQKYLLAYIVDNIPTATIPIQISNQGWKIQKVDQKLTQVFRQIPIVGSPPLKWNAVINCNNFHTNEQGSNLLFDMKDQEIKPKVIENATYLLNCYQAMKQLYIFLGEINCQQGIQNLLILDAYTQYSLIDYKVRAKTHQYINTILNTKFIPSKLGEKSCKCSFRQLIFIQSSNTSLSQIQRKKLSFEMNKNFSFLFQDNCVLESSVYQKFYDMLDYFGPYQFKYAHINQRVFQNTCLIKLQSCGFNRFQKHFKQNTFQVLHHIYDMINQFKTFPSNNFIFLNEKLQFGSFLQGVMMKKTINKTQQKILDLLEVSFRDQTIHSQFVYHFKQRLQNYSLDESYLQSKIREKIIKVSYYQYNKQFHQEQLLLLFRFLLTLNLFSSSELQSLSKLKLFNNKKQFAFKDQMNEDKILSKNCLNQLLQYFKKGTLYFLQSKAKNQSLINFLQNTFVQFQKQHPSSYFKSLFKQPILGQSFCYMKVKLNIDQVFVQEKNLINFYEKFPFPTQNDIEAYNILKKKKQPTLTSFFVNDIYPQMYIYRVKLINYNQLYSNIKPNYSWLKSVQKQKILKYATQTYFSIYKYKRVAWKDFLEDKYNSLLKSRKNNPLFQSLDVKQQLFPLMSDPKKFQLKLQNYYKRNHSENSVTIEIDQAQDIPQKKIKTD